MTGRFVCHLAFLALFGPHYSSGQNLINDTIKVSANAGPIITFPGNIFNADCACGNDSYTLRQSDKRLIIMPKGSNPISPCTFVVDEGTKKKKRHHTFILIFVDGNLASNQYDYSTTDLLQERVDELKKHKEDQSPPPPAPLSVKPTAVTAPVPAPSQTIDGSSGNDSIILGSLHIYQKDFEQKVKKQLDNFRSFCEGIAIGGGDYMQAINTCVKNVFEGKEDVQVQVTSRSSPDPIAYPIRRYLNNMARYHYQKVTIEQKEITFISQLRQEGGKWYGHVSYIQNFTSWRHDKVAISDQVKKDVEIVVETFQDIDALTGKSSTAYKIFLGNITVSQKS